MEENSKSNVTFNIYGGNNQILPNATEAVQTSMATNSQTKSSIQKANPPMHLMKMSSVSLYILIR